LTAGRWDINARIPEAAGIGKDWLVEKACRDFDRWTDATVQMSHDLTGGQVADGVKVSKRGGHKLFFEPRMDAELTQMNADKKCPT